MKIASTEGKVGEGGGIIYRELELKVTAIMTLGETFIKSNHFVGLRSSKDYYKRPGGGVGIWEGSLGC